MWAVGIFMVCFLASPNFSIYAQAPPPFHSIEFTEYSYKSDGKDKKNSSKGTADLTFPHDANIGKISVSIKQIPFTPLSGVTMYYQKYDIDNKTLIQAKLPLPNPVPNPASSLWNGEIPPNTFEPARRYLVTVTSVINGSEKFDQDRIVIANAP